MKFYEESKLMNELDNRLYIELSSAQERVRERILKIDMS